MSIHLRLPLALVFALWCNAAQALPALFDFGRGPVQDGWAQVTTSTLSATSEGVGLTLVPQGNPLEDRDRGLSNGGGAENDMWRDFFFINAEDTSISPADRGFDITLTGLVPDAIYDVTIWAFDVSSTGRSSRWNGELQTIGIDPPETLDDETLTIQVTADAAGTALVVARSSSSPINTAPFVNGMRVEFSAIPEPSTALLMGLGLLGLASGRR